MKTLLVITWSASLMALVAEIKGGDKDDDSQWSGNLRAVYGPTTAKSESGVQNLVGWPKSNSSKVLFQPAAVTNLHTTTTVTGLPARLQHEHNVSDNFIEDPDERERSSYQYDDFAGSAVTTDPCSPSLSPCGPNSVCMVDIKTPNCFCLPGYVGIPPDCKIECDYPHQCPYDNVCFNRKCVDICYGACGIRAECQVTDFKPSCSCPSGYTGDPKAECVLDLSFTTPAVPSLAPYGPNSVCTINIGTPKCFCLSGYVGTPPNCKPECDSSLQCPYNGVCSNRKCVPICHVPFTTTTAPRPLAPYGPHSACRMILGTRKCFCLSGYVGTPPNCKPECDSSLQCPYNSVCSNEKCVPICHGACGVRAECQVIDHKPSCSCPPGYTGDPKAACELYLDKKDSPKSEASKLQCTPNHQCPDNETCISGRCTDICPLNCGLGAKCEIVNHIANCTCPPGEEGDPYSKCSPIQRCTSPSCGQSALELPDNKPECTINNDCSAKEVCLNRKCVNSCSGTCGVGAECHITNHVPFCSCPPGLTGDPYNMCV